MSLLKKLIQETAAGGTTGAHAIAGSGGHGGGSLFGGGIVNPEKSKKKQRKMMRRMMTFKESITPSSEETNFDASGVISKIDAAEKKARANDETTAFGLEDEDGNIVKVYVNNEQAEDFEKALAMALSGEDANNDDENSSTEIAEVLFKLKDKFEIVDVEWGNFEGDEEEEQEVEGDLDTGEEGMEGAEGDLGIDGEMEPSADEADAKSALQSVIDVMKADADAKKAEAEAKEAEAKAKEAEYTSKSAAAKVQQEEEILDMETHNKAQSDKKKEAQQLAKLAKFKHDTATTAETELSTGDDMEFAESAEEEEVSSSSFISTSELSKLIMTNLRAS
jgi:hypothetical protein